MRLRSAVGEAARNLASGSAHAVRWALVLGAAFTLLLTADSSSIDELLARAAAFRGSGGDVLTIQAPGLIDASGCRALASVTAVEASGAVRVGTRLTPVVLPSTPLAVFETTPGFEHVIGAARDAGSTGAWLSSEAAEAIGLDRGDALRTTDGSVPVAGEYLWPEDGRRRGFGYAVLLPVDTREPFDECWVRTASTRTNVRELLGLAVAPDPTRSVPVTIAQLNSTNGEWFDGERAYRDRSTRHAPTAAVVIGLAVGWSAVRSRRLELASARHVGVSANAQRVIVAVESATWLAGLAIVSAAVCGLLGTSLPHAGPAIAREIGARTVTPGLLAAAVGAQIAVASVSERQLFRYFRGR